MAKTTLPITPANLVSIVSILLFLTIPFLASTQTTAIIDSLIGRFVLVAFVLYAITLGPLPGVFGFLAVAAIFAERNRHRILITQQSIISRGSIPTLGEVDTRHSVPASVGSKEKDIPWLHYESTGSLLEGDGWQGPVGPSEDDKHVLESQLYPNDRQDRFYVNTGLAPENPHA